MSEAGDPVSVEGTGDTVGEARWAALRELERQVGTVDPAVVEIVVVSEGERGLLGVGKEPARVLARISSTAATPAAVCEVAEVANEPEPHPERARERRRCASSSTSRARSGPSTA